MLWQKLDTVGVYLIIDPIHFVAVVVETFDARTWTAFQERKEILSDSYFQEQIVCLSV